MNDYDDFAQFKRENEVRNKALDAKTAVVVILIMSLIFFTAVGKENAKHIVLYWAAFMMLLVIGCVVQDLLISRKIKRMGKDSNA